MARRRKAALHNANELPILTLEDIQTIDDYLQSFLYLVKMHGWDHAGEWLHRKMAKGRVTDDQADAVWTLAMAMA
jgi:hypothetical protein